MKRDPRAYRPTVAFQGARGAFSEEALLEHFGGEATPLPRHSFREVVEAVAAGDADRGVLPVENTLAGTVTAAYDALAGVELEVGAEVIHPIRHCLLGITGARTEELRRIVSHPVALAQCTRFLSAHPHADSVAVYDTAGGARQVARNGDPGVAAVAARGAAERYGLEILEADIQDRSDNQTRFYIVGPPGWRGDEAVHADAGLHKTVVLLEVEDRPGSLLGVLAPFARREINLTKLESRPADVPWRYRFLVEVVTAASPEREEAALREVRKLTSAFRVLGRFPAAPRG